MENWLIKSENEYIDNQAQNGRIIHDLVGFEDRRKEMLPMLRERYTKIFALCNRANSIITTTKGCEIKQNEDCFFSIKKYERTFGGGGHSDSFGSTSTLNDLFEVIFDADDAGFCTQLRVTIDKREFKTDAIQKSNVPQKRYHFSIEEFDALTEHDFVHLIKILALHESSNWDLFLKSISSEYRNSIS